jgi:hypothetical protein
MAVSSSDGFNLEKEGFFCASLQFTYSVESYDMATNTGSYSQGHFHEATTQAYIYEENWKSISMQGQHH